MSEPPVQPTPEQPVQQALDPGPQPGEVRSQLMKEIVKAQDNPDLAETVYSRLGFNVPGVSIKGYRSMMSELQPGDLVGWKGGSEPTGQYIGNIAIYTGNREIIESYYGTVRRRKLNPDENTFGMPVNRPGDENPPGIPEH